jgi:dipeptidase E
VKQLFLTSEVKLVAGSIRQKIKTDKDTLRTAFITTPLERGLEDDDLEWHKQNKEAMVKVGFDIFEYTITERTLKDLQRDLSKVDVIYVEGGSLVFMMNQARRSGFDVFVRAFIERGGIYIGTSTGSFIMAEETGPGLSLETYLEENFDSRGIGLVNFLVMPHWGSDYFKKSYRQMPVQAYKMTTPMIVLTDTQYVWVTDEKVQIVDVAKMRQKKKWIKR